MHQLRMTTAAENADLQQSMETAFWSSKVTAARLYR